MNLLFPSKLLEMLGKAQNGVKNKGFFLKTPNNSNNPNIPNNPNYKMPNNFFSVTR